MAHQGSYLASPPMAQQRLLSDRSVSLSMRQQPIHGLVTSDSKLQMRKPIDPPPIIQIDVGQDADPGRQYLFNPYAFMQASLIPADDRADPNTASNQTDLVIGQTCSSLHRIKDLDNTERGFFVFGDISVRRTGRYRLRFALYDFNKFTCEVYFVADVCSAVFSVYASKDFVGMDESTSMSRNFNEQGVKLKMRKLARDQNSKHHHPSAAAAAAAAAQAAQAASIPRPPQQQATPPEHWVAPAVPRGVKRRHHDDDLHDLHHAAAPSVQDIRAADYSPQQMYYPAPVQSQYPHLGGNGNGNGNGNGVNGVSNGVNNGINGINGVGAPNGFHGSSYYIPQMVQSPMLHHQSYHLDADLYR